MNDVLERQYFGTTRDGEVVSCYTLRNNQGMVLRLLDYGALILELWVPDRQGELADVVLGFDSLAAYQQDSPYFGAVIGRVANRIAGASFELEGKRIL